MVFLRVLLCIYLVKLENWYLLVIFVIKICLIFIGLIYFCRVILLENVWLMVVFGKFFLLVGVIFFICLKWLINWVILEFLDGIRYGCNKNDLIFLLMIRFIGRFWCFILFCVKKWVLFSLVDLIGIILLLLLLIFLVIIKVGIFCVIFFVKYWWLCFNFWVILIF